MRPGTSSELPRGLEPAAIQSALDRLQRGQCDLPEVARELAAHRWSTTIVTDPKSSDGSAAFLCVHCPSYAAADLARRIHSLDFLARHIPPVPLVDVDSAGVDDQRNPVQQSRAGSDVATLRMRLPSGEPLNSLARRLGWPPPRQLAERWSRQLEGLRRALCDHGLPQPFSTPGDHEPAPVAMDWSTKRELWEDPRWREEFWIDERGQLVWPALSARIAQAMLATDDRPVARPAAVAIHAVSHLSHKGHPRRSRNARPRRMTLVALAAVALIVPVVVVAVRSPLVQSPATEEPAAASGAPPAAPEVATTRSAALERAEPDLAGETAAGAELMSLEPAMAEPSELESLAVATPTPAAEPDLLRPLDLPPLPPPRLSLLGGSENASGVLDPRDFQDSPVPEPEEDVAESSESNQIGEGEGTSQAGAAEGASSAGAAESLPVPPVTSPLIALAVTDTVTHHHWPLELPPAPIQTRTTMRLEEVTPERDSRLATRWLMPVVDAEGRRHRGLLDIRKSEESPVGVRIRLECRVGRQLELELWAAATLEPSSPWQAVSDEGVAEALDTWAAGVEQIDRALAVLEQQAESAVDRRVRDRVRDQRRLLRQRRDQIEQWIERGTELRELMARVEAEIRLAIHVE